MIEFEDEEFLSQVAAAEAAALSSSSSASKPRRIFDIVTPTSKSTRALNSSKNGSTTLQNSNNTTTNIGEDEEFLSQVAAAEAAVSSSSNSASKRRRISDIVTPTSNSTCAVNSSKNSSTTLHNSNNTTTNIGEGAYIAALKGSKSLNFQQQAATISSSSVWRQTYTPYSTGNYSSSSVLTLDSGNTCFKCGKSGHWARNCNAAPINDEYDPASFPEKKCPCGLGNCIILTANTEKNRGRKFYKCPIRQDNGGCDFFDWCDKPSFTHPTTIQNSSSTNFSILELSCPCGAGPCLVLTAKTGKNIGQQFYRCPSQESCGFFKWCNETTTVPTLKEPQKAPQFYQSMNSMCNKSYSNSDACFKCGKEGHLMKDCVQSPADVRAKSNSTSIKSHNSTTCFKCGKEGHWVKDCVNSVLLSSPGDGVGKSTASTSCFKCGGAGHWAKDCTSVVAIRPPRAE